MPQNDYIERHIKLYGHRLDHEKKTRKHLARSLHKKSLILKNLRGIKAKIQNRKRYTEKVELKRRIKSIVESKATAQSVNNEEVPVPSYLLGRNNVNRTNILSNTVKQKRKEKAGKWQVPIPKVKAIDEYEMFRVIKTGKRKKKTWKRLIDKPCFVPQDFTRKPPKFERFIRPSGLRFKRAHVTHPELKTTFYLDIIGVKKNPQSTLYTSLGVLTKGTIIEVDVSDLGLVTQTGNVIWAKYAQITNNPEVDGCVNSILLV